MFKEDTNYTNNNRWLLVSIIHTHGALKRHLKEHPLEIDKATGFETFLGTVFRDNHQNAFDELEKHFNKKQDRHKTVQNLNYLMNQTIREILKKE